VGGPHLKRRPLAGGQDVEHCAGQLGWGRHLVVGQLGASGIAYPLDCVAYNKTAVNSRTADDVVGNRRVTTTTYQIYDVAHLQAGVCADVVAGSRKSAYTAGTVMVCCLPVIVGADRHVRLPE
jgi:hypothetical protein